jgi:tetratricopeptide (TPR) repeat protein
VLILARLAEVRLMEGDTRAAHRSAQRALELDPESARAQTIAGFVALARIDTRAAHAAFDRAIELDSLDPLAHLGRSLATIRKGDLEAGRAELELAVALDPDNALLRSYLAKAYMEEHRQEIAGDELGTAKALDPNDPTPWYYDAIRKELGNRPIEALSDLETAIRLNDRRAVYRSRLLLDEDRASRGVKVARIYDDIGFGSLGTLRATRSLIDDPADDAAHLFLADSYARDPRLDLARVSEFLQAQLLQPLGPSPIEPGDLLSIGATSPTSQSVAPLTREGRRRLFDAEGLSGTAQAVLGTQGTRGDRSKAAWSPARRRSPQASS